MPSLEWLAPGMAAALGGGGLLLQKHHPHFQKQKPSRRLNPDQKLSDWELGEFPLMFTPPPKRFILGEEARYYHLECIGASGTGKNRFFLLPCIYQDILRGACVIIIDPKSVMLRQIAAYAASCGRSSQFRYLDLANPAKSFTYSPFTRDDPGQMAESLHASLTRHRNAYLDVWGRTKGWWFVCAFLFPAMALGSAGLACLFAALSWIGLRELDEPRAEEGLGAYWRRWIFPDLLIVAVYLPIAWGMRHAPITGTIALSLFGIGLAPGVRRDWGAGAAPWTLVIAVFCQAFVPLLMDLRAPGRPEYTGAHLLIFLVVTTQMSDVFQYLAGKAFGRTPLSRLSPKKTWEGLIGGGLAATVLGTLLVGLTPFSRA